MAKEKLIIKDPLYKQIFVKKEHKKYLDSPEFQRLRSIKQLAFVDYVYPSANHTRFSHSLGAYHLMKKLVSNNLMFIDSDTKNDLMLSALFHDVGHGPFSHSWEKVFTHFDHEKATEEILKKFKLDKVAKIIDKKHKYSALITSALDVDKMDYLSRDGYFAGAFSGVEVEFILHRMFVKNGKMCIKRSALPSVEDLLLRRVHMGESVYFHKTSVQCDFLFEQIFRRVREIIKEDKIYIHINKHIRAFFEKKNTIDDLLALNDTIILSHIHEWTESSDKLLSDLCQKLLNRNSLKTIRLVKGVNINKIKKAVSKKYDLNYYFAEKKLSINPVQTQLYVEANEKLVEIEKVSDIFKHYKNKKIDFEYVIFPRDVKI